MPELTKHTIKAADQTRFTVGEYLAAKADSAPVIQILHGMAEHTGRYEALGERLQSEGYSVWLHNPRGHGERTPIGHLQKDEWNLVIDDIARIQAQLLEGRKLILLGHSMGSFIARDFALQHGEALDGLILSGSNAEAPILFQVGHGLASLLSKLRGAERPSGLMRKLSFSNFNKHFSDVQTESDWLSRDADVVQAFIDDPLCGFDCTPGFWRELFSALVRINKHNAFTLLPKDLPVYIFSGSEDPVGHRGKGVERLHAWMQRGGLQDVELKLYAGGRHEMLNEINKDEVIEDLLGWLRGHR